MTTATMTQAGVREFMPSVLADARTVHREAAAILAELDLDDAALWDRVGELVTELAATARRTASALTGEPAGATSRNVPPIVRMRDLAVAQRRLSGVLDAGNTLDDRSGTATRAATDRVRAVVRLLR